MPNWSTRERKLVRRPSDAEVRSSAARIVDILQQLVIARPEMIIPLEEIVRGILANLRVSVEKQMWQREDELRSSRRTPLPALPLSELPAMQALLKPPGAEKRTRHRAGSSAEKHRRR